MALGASPIGTGTLTISVEGEHCLLEDVYKALGSLHGITITVDEDGQARDARGGALSVLVNARHAHHLRGPKTPVRDGDRISILPLLSGG
ncbi:MAG: MoaD/ThiS family protein [Firmicutes bacterium]|nr:MoaD/ThiS family protein [Bacillota bacterium]